jgi:carbonic anhydrase
MKVLYVLVIVSVALAEFSWAAVATPHWTYAESDLEWSELTASDGSRPFSACVGQRQSPVDLVNVYADPSLRPLGPSWSAFQRCTVTNNGHTIQVDQTSVSAPSFTDPNTGIDYSLLQFHFHSPSEHTWSGAYRDLEVHLVHRSLSGTLLVIGVSFVSSPYGANSFLNQFWTSLVNLQEGNLVTRNIPLNFTDALPANPTYSTYPGSLTTPPCSEIVTWYVMDEAIPISVDQLAAFRSALRFTANNPDFTVNGNSRRVQRIGSRTIRRYVEAGNMPPIDKNDMGNAPGRVSTAAIVIGCIALVLGAAALALTVLPVLTKAPAPSSVKSLEMRDKEKLTAAAV